MRLFVRINGIDPFVLRLHDNLQLEHYKQIVQQYYEYELYDGKPPGPLYLRRIIRFNKKKPAADHDAAQHSDETTTTGSTTNDHDDDNDASWDANSTTTTATTATTNGYSMGDATVGVVGGAPIPPSFNGSNDMLFEYTRRDTLMNKFSLEVQITTHVYDEVEATDESMLLTKSPNAALCENLIPKFASLNRLILKFSDLHTDPYIRKVFWYTYREFTTPDVLLQKLIERYNVPPLNDERAFSQLDYEYFDRLRFQIQAHVCELLVEWIDNYYWDFDDNMVATLEQFAKETLKADGYDGIAVEILDHMRRGNRLPIWQRVPRVEDLNLNTNPNAYYNTLDLLTPRQLAEQLTYFDHENYRRIHFSEMLGQAWNKAHKRHTAPNLMRAINGFNHVSNWAAYMILTTEDIVQRRRWMTFLILTMQELRALRSYNMIMALTGAFASAAVGRLTKTYEELKKDIIAIHEGMKDLVATNQNFLKLRAVMTKNLDNHPTSPYIGTFLTDIVFTSDQPMFMDGKINFGRSCAFYNCMYEALKFQEFLYQITPIEEFQRYLREIKLYEDEKTRESEFYAMSLRLQPRQARN